MFAYPSQSKWYVMIFAVYLYTFTYKLQHIDNRIIGISKNLVSTAINNTSIYWYAMTTPKQRSKNNGTRKGTEFGLSRINNTKESLPNFLENKYKP